jgi:hypothetical protein
LNPARAELAGGSHGKLANYPWSSLRHYAKGNPPSWQPMERVLEGFKLSKDRRGRTSYLTWLEARAMEHGRAIDGEAMEELKHLKKSDARKVVCAALVKRRTSVSNKRIAERLAMGHPAPMSQHVNRMRKEPKATKRLNQHDKALKSKD